MTIWCALSPLPKLLSGGSARPQPPCGTGRWASKSLAILSLFPSYFFNLVGFFQCPSKHQPSLRFSNPFLPKFSPLGILLTPWAVILIFLLMFTHLLSIQFHRWSLECLIWDKSSTQPSYMKICIPSCDTLRELQRPCSVLAPHVHLKCINILTLDCSRNNLFTSPLKSTFPPIVLAF